MQVGDLIRCKQKKMGIGIVVDVCPQIDVGLVVYSTLIIVYWSRGIIAATSEKAVETIS